MTTEAEDLEIARNSEREALAYISDMLPLIEQAATDMKLARTVEGRYDCQISAVAVIYRRAFRCIRKAVRIQEHPRIPCLACDKDFASFTHMTSHLIKDHGWGQDPETGLPVKPEKEEE